MKYKTIFFDVDGTLTEGKSSAWNLITVELGMPLEEHIDILAKFRNQDISLNQAIEGIVRLWRRSYKATRANLTEILARIDLRPGAIDFVEHIRSLGIEPVLLSGTPDINIQRVQEITKIETAYTSTKFEFDEEDMIKWFEYADNEEQAKLDHFNHHLKKFSIDPKETMMIGNGDNDLLVMKACGKSMGPEDSTTAVIESVDHVFKDFITLKEEFESLIEGS